MRILLFSISIIFFSFKFCYSQQSDSIKNKYLIVVDIQEYYTNGKLKENVSQKIIDSVNYVINSFSANNVIYIQSKHRLLNLSFAPPFIFVTFDSLAMRFDKRLNLINETIFMKDKSNIFTINELNNFLKQNNAKDIVIIGLMAEEYILESLLAGKTLGYNMYMIPNAIEGKSDKSKKKAINKLINKEIKILDIIKLS